MKDSKWHLINKMFRSLGDGEAIGDAAVYKLALFYKEEGPTPSTKDVLQFEELNFQPIIMEDLKKKATHSFGWAYYEFMNRNQLKPMNFSNKTRPYFKKHPVSIRYIRVHDMFHTLLGYEADLKGEVAVYAFIGEQNYAPALNQGAKVAQGISHLLMWQRKEIRSLQREAKAKARNAKNLIIQPLEELLDQPLVDVRKSLGLPT